jgi:hypothetical protein
MSIVEEFQAWQADEKVVPPSIPAQEKISGPFTFKEYIALKKIAAWYREIVSHGNTMFVNPDSILHSEQFRKFFGKVQLPVLQSEKKEKLAKFIEVVTCNQELSGTGMANENLEWLDELFKPKKQLAYYAINALTEDKLSKSNVRWLLGVLWKSFEKDVASLHEKYEIDGIHETTSNVVFTDPQVLTHVLNLCLDSHDPTGLEYQAFCQWLDTLNCVEKSLDTEKITVLAEAVLSADWDHVIFRDPHHVFIAMSAYSQGLISSRQMSTILTRQELQNETGVYRVRALRLLDEKGQWLEKGRESVLNLCCRAYYAFSEGSDSESIILEEIKQLIVSLPKSEQVFFSNKRGSKLTQGVFDACAFVLYGKEACRSVPTISRISSLKIERMIREKKRPVEHGYPNCSGYEQRLKERRVHGHFYTPVDTEYHDEQHRAISSGIPEKVLESIFFALDEIRDVMGLKGRGGAAIFRFIDMIRINSSVSLFTDQDKLKAFHKLGLLQQFAQMIDIDKKTFFSTKKAQWISRNTRTGQLGLVDESTNYPVFFAQGVIDDISSHHERALVLSPLWCVVLSMIFQVEKWPSEFAPDAWEKLAKRHRDEALACEDELKQCKERYDANTRGYDECTPFFPSEYKEVEKAETAIKNNQKNYRHFLNLKEAYDFVLQYKSHIEEDDSRWQIFKLCLFQKVVQESFYFEDNRDGSVRKPMYPLAISDEVKGEIERLNTIINSVKDDAEIDGALTFKADPETRVVGIAYKGMMLDVLDFETLERKVLMPFEEAEAAASKMSLVY